MPLNLCVSFIVSKGDALVIGLAVAVPVIVAATIAIACYVNFRRRTIRQDEMRTERVRAAP